MRLRANIPWLCIWLGAVLFGLVLRVFQPAFLVRLENQLYDWRLRHATRFVGSKEPQTVIVAIDEKSLDAIGRWPWDRRIIAKLLDRIFDAGARVAVLDIVFSEPQVDQISRILARIDGGRPIKERSAAAKPEAPDQALASAIQRHREKLVLGYFLHRSESEIEGVDSISRSEQMREIDAQKAILKFHGVTGYWHPLKAILPETNISIFTHNSEYQGHFNFESDDDGVVRRAWLIMTCGDRQLPSLSVASVWASEKSAPEVQVDADGSVLLTVGSIRVPLDHRGSMLIPYRGPPGTIPTLSALDVLEGRVGDRLKDRDVLVGCTALGISDFRVTPFSKLFPGVEIQASVLDAMRNGIFLQEPGAQHFIADCLIIIVCGVIIGGAMRRISVFWGLLLGLGLLAALAWINFLAFSKAGWPMQWIAPGSTIILTYAGLAAYRYGTEERDKRRLRKAFQYYLDAPVVEEIIRDHHKLNLGGEEKEVSALFCDIRGFTTLSEKLPAATIAAFVNDYLTVMSQSVQKHRGLVDKFVGDALIALFGALPEDTQHADEACAAALEMLSQVAGLNERWCEKLAKTEVRIGIGINTGKMIVGNFGSRDRFNYTALGVAMNEASRLEELTKQYKVPIIIGGETKRQIDGGFRTRELGEVTVRGSTKPMKIFALEPGVASS